MNEELQEALDEIDSDLSLSPSQKIAKRAKLMRDYRAMTNSGGESFTQALKSSIGRSLGRKLISLLFK